MRNTLRIRLAERLKEWSSVLDAGTVYVNQPMAAFSIDQDGEKTSCIASNVEQLVDQCSRRVNARVIIYAEAGMGKTTVLRHMARSWLEGTSQLVKRFDYVLLIPLRLARSHTLTDVICQDLQLLPQDYKNTLGKILSTSDRVCFLLDSYEELSFDMGDIKNEIDRLITRGAHSGNSIMMVVSSRPGSGLDEIIDCLKDRLTVNLKDFTDKDVECYIENYSADAKEKERFFSLIEKFGNDFLKRPINLSLICYLYKTTGVGNTGAEGQGISQTKLFNQMVKHILHVYLKKQWKMDSEVDALSLLGSKDRKLGPAKAMLKDICQMCYQARRKNYHFLYTQNCEDLIDFGLFAPGPDENSVSVPHLLIMEFFAAVYLVGNKEAWTELFEEIDGKCGKGETRRSLEDVVRELGLENITRFVVGLSPDVAQQLHSLFVIKQQKIWDSGYQTVYSYQLQLLHESEVKSGMAEALCNAPVISVSGEHECVRHSGADQLLDVFTVEQSHQFLAKAYDCVINSNSVNDVTMCRINTDRGKCLVCDSYVMRCLLKFRCTALEVCEHMWVQDNDISVELLTLLTSAVNEKMSIEDCRLLCAGSGEYIDRLLQSMPAPTLREIDIYNSELQVDTLRLLTSTVNERMSIEDCSFLRAESGEYIDRLLQLMAQPALREIDVDNSELPVDALRLLTSAVSEKLSIDGCRFLCADGGEHIDRLPQSMPAPTLREIDIDNSELPVDALQLLTSAVTEKLSIWKCRLLFANSRKHIDRLHSMLQPTLREIDIRYSEFPVDALRLLISAVSKKLIINSGTLLCGGDKGSRCEVVHNTRSVLAPTVSVVLQCYLNDQSGRSLTNMEAKQIVRNICSSATVTTKYWVSQCTSSTLNTTPCF